MKKILIISFSVIKSDPRVMRQIRFLENRAKITVAGFGAAPDANCDFIELQPVRATLVRKVHWALMLLAKQFERYCWKRPEVIETLGFLFGRSFDLVIANDNAALPVALKLANKNPVLMDAHEYSPMEFSENFLWRLLFGPYQDYLCRTYLPQASAMSTVCQGIADAYRDNYGVCPRVVMNAPFYKKLKPSRIASNKIRIIHHGAALRARHLESIIDVMMLLDERFSLDLMLVETDSDYMKTLRKRAASNPRIRFVQPVGMEDICEKINGYDLGIYLLAPVNFNHEYALPNKLFEFVQARLAVAIGPSPEMARIVEQYGLGVVANTFEPSDLAAELTRLTKLDIEGYKRSADLAANELCYEHSAEILLEQIDGLFCMSASKGEIQHASN